MAQASLSRSSQTNGVQNSDRSNSAVERTSVEPVEKRRDKSVEKKGKTQATKNKGIKVVDVSKKKSKPNAKPGNAGFDARASKINLRQSTLAFQPQTPKEAERAPPSERIAHPAPSGTNATKPKAKSNVTVLGNREFGTSTPVSRSNQSKKRFQPDSTNVSPIGSKDKTVLQKK